MDAFEKFVEIWHGSIFFFFFWGGGWDTCNAVSLSFSALLLVCDGDDYYYFGSNKPLVFFFVVAVSGLWPVWFVGSCRVDLFLFCFG